MNGNFRRTGKVALLITGVFAIAMLGTTKGSSHASNVTFTKDIAPIIYKNCAGCHRPGEIAPMSLLTYKEVRPWAKSIRERVVERSMPRWSADPKYGHWANDPRLYEKDIAAIVEWVGAGAPKGEHKNLPPMPKFTEGWTIGTPDAVIQMAEEYTVP